MVNSKFKNDSGYEALTFKALVRKQSVESLEELGSSVSSCSCTFSITNSLSSSILAQLHNCEQNENVLSQSNK